MTPNHSDQPQPFIQKGRTEIIQSLWQLSSAGNFGECIIDIDRQISTGILRTVRDIEVKMAFNALVSWCRKETSVLLAYRIFNSVPEDLIRSIRNL